ncbi:MAG: hypothetical protein KAR24_03615 [Candidatus Pacebacteria bacterium]|nr:hypothetical protein [Candidatus Paceibacterota bacterium]
MFILPPSSLRAIGEAIQSFTHRAQATTILWIASPMARNDAFCNGVWKLNI